MYLCPIRNTGGGLSPNTLAAIAPISLKRAGGIRTANTTGQTVHLLRLPLSRQVIVVIGDCIAYKSDRSQPTGIDRKAEAYHVLANLARSLDSQPHRRFVSEKDVEVAYCGRRCKKSFPYREASPCQAGITAAMQEEKHGSAIALEVNVEHVGIVDADLFFLIVKFIPR